MKRIDTSPGRTAGFLKTIVPFLTSRPLQSYKDVSGNINYVFIINNDFVVRWQKFVPYSFEDIGSNKNALLAIRKLAKSSFKPLPEVVTCKEKNNTSYLVVKKTEGKTLLAHINACPPSEKQILAKKMAQTLASFHCISVAQWGAFHDPRFCGHTDWYSYLMSWVEHQLSHLKNMNLMSEETASRIRLVFSKRKEVFNKVKQPYFIHEELNPQNIMADDKGNINSILDFDKAKGGDPLADFSITLLNCLLDVDDDFVKVFSDEYLHIYNNNLSVHKEKIHRNSDIITLYTLFYTLKLFPVAYQYKFPNFEKYPAEVMRLLSSLE